ncbi:MAG TPA: hypothetical protein VF755_01005 [Catenuloplanes sp.]|jgi:hypothetical protein
MLPDAEALAVAWLRGAPDLTGIGFGTQRPPDLAARLPFVVVERIGGTAEAPSWRAGALVDRAGINVQAWAGPHRIDARRLIHTVVHSLLSIRGVARPGGVIVRVAMLAGPTALPDPSAPDTVHRFTTSVQVTAH